MLRFEYIQGDPFAPPSLLSLRLPFPETDFPASLIETPVRRTAFADFLSRLFGDAINEFPRGFGGTGNSGKISIDRGGQEVLERSSLSIENSELQCRFFVGLPAQGRRVLGRKAADLLLDTIPTLAGKTLVAESVDLNSLSRHVQCVEDQAQLRLQLQNRNLLTFIANGSVLPRKSGIHDGPLKTREVVPFQSPSALEVTLEAPNAGPVTGMGIPQGINLIVGGGFHGKSTLLKAIERGVYDHLPGDGREQVVTLDHAAKVRAEDGRSVQGVDISAFIGDLPNGQETRHFVTQNASGSTSQAANIVEAIELGSRLLLIDEDTSATNFILRDARMQALVTRSNEPISPLIDRIRDLYERFSVSVIMVMGGSGDYFDVSDEIVMLTSYRAIHVTRDAKEIATQIPNLRRSEPGSDFPEDWVRYPDASSFDSRRGRSNVKISARGLQTIRYGDSELLLAGLEQLVDSSQTRAIGLAIHKLAGQSFSRDLSLKSAIVDLEHELNRDGLDCLDPRIQGDLARPRSLEIGAAINRMRGLRVKRRD